MNNTDYTDYKEKQHIRNETLRRKHHDHTDEYLVEYDQFMLSITPGVFNPVYGEGARLMTQCQEELMGDKILDMGTGSGAIAMLAAKYCQQVVACDISPVSVKCAKKNILKNNLGHKIDVFQSDLFDSISSHEKFDIITFNPPFLENDSDDVLGKSMDDSNYSIMSRFFNNVRNYMKEDGKILLCFGEVGDLGFLGWLLRRYSLTSTKVVFMYNFTLEFFVIRITI